MSNQGYVHCPECKRWVPQELMNYDVDENGRLIRVCSLCLEGKVDQSPYVLDELHEKTRCIWCKSYDTVEHPSQWNVFTCNHCGRTFRRL